MSLDFFSKVFFKTFAIWQAALPAMFFGCWCGVVLRRGKIFVFFSKLTRPLTWLGNIPKELGPFFILCLLNRYAANALLADCNKNNNLAKNTIIAVYLMGSLPTGLYFTIFYFSPILFSALGTSLGGKFIIIHVLLSLFVTFAGIFWQRLTTQTWENFTMENEPLPANLTSKTATIMQDLHSTWLQFRAIAVVFMPVTLLFALLLSTSWLTQLTPHLDKAFQTFSLSTAGVMVIIAGIPTLVAAIGLAGTLYLQGMLSSTEVIFVLLIASFGHNIYDSCSRVWPSNVAIFGLRLGTSLTLVGTTLYLASVVLAITISYQYL